jgi:cadmium resistance protein CadD (predicted permease)
MGNLIIVLGALFVGLIIMVNIAKLTAQKEGGTNMQKYYRWIPVLLITGLCIQLIMHFTGK